MPYFWQLAINPKLKIQMGMLILMQNLSNFVPPAWKLDTLYCHTVYDVRLIVSYRSYNLNVILVRILDKTYISSPFLDPHGSAKILYFSIEIFHA